MRGCSAATQKAEKGARVRFGEKKNYTQFWVERRWWWGDFWRRRLLRGGRCGDPPGKTEPEFIRFLPARRFWHDARLLRCDPTAANERGKEPDLFQTLSRRSNSRADNRRQERKIWRSQGGSTPKATWSPTSEYVFACRTGAPVSVHGGFMMLWPGKVPERTEGSKWSLDRRPDGCRWLHGACLLV